MNEISSIDLSPFAEEVNGALDAGSPGVLASAGPDGPALALKGSLMVWDRDHLAYWERSLLETFAALRASPGVAVLCRRQGQPPLRFYGEASFVDDPALRSRVWERVHPREQAADPEGKGYAVLIRVDRVRRGRAVVQRREL